MGKIFPGRGNSGTLRRFRDLGRTLVGTAIGLRVAARAAATVGVRLVETEVQEAAVAG